MKNLESNQVYGNSPYLNQPDHPAERMSEPGPYLCGCCQESFVDEEDCWCDECYEIMTRSDETEIDKCIRLLDECVDMVHDINKKLRNAIYKSRRAENDEDPHNN